MPENQYGYTQGINERGEPVISQPGWNTNSQANPSYQQYQQYEQGNQPSINPNIPPANSSSSEGPVCPIIYDYCPESERCTFWGTKVDLETGEEVEGCIEIQRKISEDRANEAKAALFEESVGLMNVLRSPDPEKTAVGAIIYRLSQLLLLANEKVASDLAYGYEDIDDDDKDESEDNADNDSLTEEDDFSEEVLENAKEAVVAGVSETETQDEPEQATVSE